MNTKLKDSYCEVYLVRHGQTKWNAEGRLQGHRDEPLNDEGEKQAWQLKEELKDIHFSAVYSSDLSRALKTASIITHEKSVVVKESISLRERDMGPWEGRTLSEIKTWFNERNISRDSYSKEEFLSLRWENDIESYANVYTRLHDFIKQHAALHLGSSILISTHGGVLRSLLLHLLDFQTQKRWVISNCACIKVHVNQEGALSFVDAKGIELHHDPLPL